MNTSSHWPKSRLRERANSHHQDPWLTGVSGLLTSNQWVGMGACSLIFVLLFIDALVHPYAFFDLQVINAVQTVEHQHGRGVTAALAWLTGTEGAIISWALVLIAFAACRWWSAAIATSLMPFGGLINEVISDVLVGRTRPHLPELVRGSTSWEEGSFPSGHVMGAVILYGFILICAKRIDQSWVRLPIQLVCLGLLSVVGVARVWQGAHWPTDVIAAYALGGVVLIGLVALETSLYPHLNGRSPSYMIRYAYSLVRARPGHAQT